MEHVSFNIDTNLRDEIMIHYASYMCDNNGEYIVFFAKKDDLTITIYESKKGYKVLFSGENPLEEALKFNKDASVKEKKKIEKIEYLDLSSQCGSDEVGFGDFFGPLVVVGAYYDESINDILSSIRDSKKLNDDFILEFVPTILSRIKFSKLTVHNEKYNEMINRGYNMNEMKALLHNQVLINLKKKIPSCQSFYIDQFCSEDTYFSYLQFEDEKVTSITFHTKGESYYPSIALASMIARYCFLKEMEVLNEKYHLIFPKGASKSVDEFAKDFVKAYSIEELKKVCKTNFTNFKKLNIND